MSNDINSLLNRINLTIKAGKEILYLDESEVEPDSTIKSHLIWLKNNGVASSYWTVDEIDPSKKYLTLFINKVNFMKIYRSLNQDIDDEVQFNEKTISYKDRSYKPETPIRCLIEMLWEDRYVIGSNKTKVGLNFSNSIAEECEISDINTSIQSFNRGANNNKIPIKLTKDDKNHRMIYLEINYSKKSKEKTAYL